MTGRNKMQLHLVANMCRLFLVKMLKCADFTVSGLTWCRGGWDQSGPMRGQYLDHVITLNQSESRGGVGSYEGRLRLCALCLGSCPREPRPETSSSIQDLLCYAGEKSR